MGSGDWAFLVSGISLAIAVGSFTWNILQKFIFVKPSVQASFGLYYIVRPISGAKKSIFSLTATNMGPGPVILHGGLLMIRGENMFKPRLAFMNPIEGDPEAVANKLA